MSSYSSNQHCVTKLVALSETHDVLASEDIYDEHGFKLLAKGTRIPPDLQDRLLMRKLRAPLETTLTLEDGVTLATVFEGASELIDSIPVLSRLAGSALARHMLQTASAIPLPSPLVLLMTCARHSGPDSFRRSQIVTALCAGLAAQRQVPVNDAHALLLAAAAHDLGEIYIDPEYLSNRPLQPAEWKHVAVHPRVGMKVVQSFSRLPHAVSACIDQHHERHDGSGYPGQLHGKAQHALSPLIAIADAVGALVARGDDAGERISLALRIVPGEFAWDLANTVIASLRGVGASKPPPSVPPVDGHATAIQLLDRLNATDQSLTAVLADAHSPPPVQEICHRAQVVLEGLTKSLRSTGVLYSDGLNEQDAHDEVLLAEMHQVVREVAWRMRYLARNIHVAIEAQGDHSLVERLSARLGLHELHDTTHLF